MTLLCRRLDAVITYLSPLLPLANCHTVEYYTDCLWSNLVPKSIQKEVEGSSLDNMVDRFFHAVNNDSKELSNSPLALFVHTSRSHHISVDGHLCLSCEQVWPKVGVQHSPCADISDQFVSHKKGHEVRQLMRLCHGLPGTHCVELGGGKGYLGEALLQSGMSSLTVDCNPVTLHGGVNRAKVMKRVLSRAYNSKDKRHAYVHQFVDKNTDLQALVRRHFPEDFDDTDECKFIITGLHTCGDLGPTSLRLFTREPAAASALCTVPCCYHHISERAEPRSLWSEFETLSLTHDEAGFPMSEHLRGFRLGRNARMLAAHSLDKITATRELPSIGLHYRAILQVLLRKHITDSEIAEGRLKGIAAKSKNFTDYCARAMKKLNVDMKIKDFSDIEKQYESQYKSLVVFYLLRLCLAQVVECVILLDRLLFLYENGFNNSFLVKLFDASISPRCHAIVATR